MAIFKPRKIIDPLTGKERIVSPEEQEALLLRGVLFDAVSAEDESESLTKEEHE